MERILKIILDIIQHELSLEDGQCLIYNQKWDIPADRRLYITAEYSGQRTIASVRREIATADGLAESQTLHSLAMVSVDLVSRGNAARTAKDLVMLALNSTYSLQMQERHGFQIARHSTQCSNVSEAEGTAMLDRYSISFNITYMTETRKPIGHYGIFGRETMTEE